MLHWILSIAALIGGLGLSGAMVWLERRPRRNIMPPLIPTTPVMFLGIIIAILAIAYMMSLAGIKPPNR